VELVEAGEGGLEWSVWEEIGGRVYALSEYSPERGWVAEEVGLEHERWEDNSRNPEMGELSA